MRIEMLDTEAEIVEGCDNAVSSIGIHRWDQTTKVINLFDVKTGTTPSTKHLEYWENGDIVWITPNDLSKTNGRIYINNSKRKVTRKALTNSNLNLLPENSIILSTRAPVGYVSLNSKVATINQGCKGLVPKDSEQTKTEFYYYYFKFIKPVLERFSGGSTFKELSKKALEEIVLPLPHSAEQCKIAAILSSVDAAIEQTDAIIAQTERMKKGLMQELLTKGIKHTVFKKTSIGRIPEKWDVIYLGNNNYFDLVTGGTPSTKNKRYWENGDIPWLLSGVIHKKRVYNTQKTISKLGYENSNATLLPKQSVLIALAGQGKTRGTTAITEIELTTNQSVAAIVSNFNYLNPYYVFYILDSMYEELRSKSSGSGRAGLSLNILREIGLPLPSLSEQNQIASTLLSVDDKLIIEKNRRIQLGRLKKGLMQDLLTGRVRVKVEDDHA